MENNRKDGVGIGIARKKGDGYWMGRWEKGKCKGVFAKIDGEVR
jgi:hypothetical protein